MAFLRHKITTAVQAPPPLASSVFGPDNRYGWFPAVSVAWRMGEENFVSALTWVTDLKLRASWGKTGYYGNTDPFNQYSSYAGSVKDAYYDINGTSNSPVQGFRSVRLGDPNTTWQEDIATNIGIEATLWEGRLFFTAEWYHKTSNGLLFPISLPDILGGGEAPNLNVGEVQNTGIDLLIGSKGAWSKEWHWDAALTLTTYENKILKLDELSYFIPNSSTALGYVRNQTGQPVSSFFGYKIIGIFQNEDEVANAPNQVDAKPGRFRYFDTNDDGTITSEDRVFFGNANPKFTAGLNLGVNFKNVDFSMFWYGSFGNDVINHTRTATDFFANGPKVAKSKRLLYDSWTPENTNASVPVIENDLNFSNTEVINSYAVEDGSYLRNKSMILGYTFPKEWLQKMKMQRMRVYGQVVNLVTITNYTGLDPELSGESAAFGIDYANYPNNQRQYLIGLNVTF